MASGDGDELPAVLNGLHLEDSQALQDQNKNFHYHWIDHQKLTLADVTSILREIKSDKKEADNNETQLRYRGIHLISKVASCVFLNKFQGDLINAEKDFANAKKLVDHAKAKNLIDTGYLEGILYVLKLLGNYVQSGLSTEINLKDDSAMEYNNLSIKGKAAVKAMKLYFYMRLPPKFQEWKERKQLATELVQMDPDHVEWYLCLYKQIYYQYKDSCYAEKERLKLDLKSAITNAFKNNPEHPQVLLYSCECLFELIRRVPKSKEGWKEEISIGDQKFAYFEDLADWVHKANKKILEADASAYMYSKIGMIWSKAVSQGLNQKYLDYAKECLEKAKELSPSSSKVLHKLGFYSLTVERNMENAIDYLRKSVECYSYNCAALSNLIRILMSDPDKNAQEIHDRIDKNLLEEAPWNKFQKAEFTYLKGQMLFMQGHISEAIKCWDQCEDRDRNWNLSYLPFQLIRYNWPKNKISLELISCEVGRRLKMDPLNASLIKISTQIKKLLGTTGSEGHVITRRGFGYKQSLCNQGQPRHHQQRGRGYSNFYSSRADTDSNWRQK